MDHGTPQARPARPQGVRSSRLGTPRWFLRLVAGSGGGLSTGVGLRSWQFRGLEGKIRRFPDVEPGDFLVEDQFGHGVFELRKVRCLEMRLKPASLS